jgi:two-component system sensor histidine kinase UhpB
LDDLGLSATLRWYAAELEHRSGIHIELDFDGEIKPLPADVKTALFRIIQEALTNVIKHAKAERVSVHLFYSDHMVEAYVMDDGCGFNADKAANTGRSYGLIGMSERAALLGGHLEVHSEPGKGTQVQVVIPYPDNVEQTEHEYSNTVS